MRWLVGIRKQSPVDGVRRRMFGGAGRPAGVRRGHRDRSVELVLLIIKRQHVYFLGDVLRMRSSASGARRWRIDVSFVVLVGRHDVDLLRTWMSKQSASVVILRQSRDVSPEPRRKLGKISGIKQEIFGMVEHCDGVR